jgi:hypothetical protein
VPNELIVFETHEELILEAFEGLENAALERGILTSLLQTHDFTLSLFPIANKKTSLIEIQATIGFAEEFVLRGLSKDEVEVIAKILRGFANEQLDYLRDELGLNDHFFLCLNFNIHLEIS